MVNGWRTKRWHPMSTVSIADFIYQRLSPIAKVADRNYEPHVSRTSRCSTTSHQYLSRSLSFSLYLSSHPPLDSTTWHDSPNGRFSPVTVRNLINYSAPIIPRVPPRNGMASQAYIRSRFEQSSRQARCKV